MITVDTTLAEYAELKRKAEQYDEMFARLQRAHEMLFYWPIDRRSGRKVMQADVDDLAVAAGQIIRFNVARDYDGA